MKDKIKWPAGNRLDLCIPLRKITVTEEGTQFGEYIPSQAAVVMVYFVGNYASYEYTPRIEDNKLFITDNGELKPGVYAIDVRIQEPERQLRSFRCGELEIVRETKQLALGDFVLNNNITLDADAFIFGEGPSAYEVAVRDGYTGTKAEWLESLRGREGRGIADIVALPTGAFRILLTDGSAYVTPTLKGEQGVSIVDFTVSSITSQEVICTITMSDGTTHQLNLPRGEKGEQGDAGEDGRGIQSVVMNNDYTLTFNYTDGTSYTTPQALRGEQGAAGQDGQDGQDGRGISSMALDDYNHLTVSYTDGTTYTTPQSLQGERGVSITDFEQVGESATMCFFNIYYSNGNISQIGLPKGEQGDRGEQGPQGPKGDTVVLGEVGEYKLYNVGGTATDGAMTQDATTKAIAAAAGYYECGTAAGTAAKVAIGDNEALYTLQKGGSIKVKMTNANAAASGVTLKIGSAAATPLYYNGAAVSASNTWEAGEVISVYYDGTNYQATNAKVGSGKAADIKYDNSQSGLEAENVQGALDEIEANTETHTEILSNCYRQGEDVITTVKNISNSDLQRGTPGGGSSTARIILKFDSLINVTGKIGVTLHIPYSAVSADTKIDRATITFYNESKTNLASLDLGWSYFKGSDITVNVDLTQDKYASVVYVGVYFGCASGSISTSSIDASGITFTLSEYKIETTKALDEVTFLAAKKDIDTHTEILENCYRYRAGADTLLSPVSTSDFGNTNPSFSGTSKRLALRKASLIEVTGKYRVSVTYKSDVVINSAVDRCSLSLYDKDKNYLADFDFGWRYFSGGDITFLVDLKAKIYESVAYIGYYFGSNSNIAPSGIDPTKIECTLTEAIGYTAKAVDEETVDKKIYGAINVPTPYDWNTQITTTQYKGGKIVLEANSYTWSVLGILKGGTNARQGGASYGDYLFQFHNTLATICVFDMTTGQTVDTITLTANPSCHAGSGGFSTTFYDVTDPFPLLYISSMDEKKVYVYRITGEVGTLSAQKIQAIVLNTTYFLPNIAIDNTNGKMVVFAYTANSWSVSDNNNSIVMSCDIPLHTAGDVTIQEFENISVLPFIYAEQGAFAKGGKLYLSYGNTETNAGIIVFDYIYREVRNVLGLRTIGVIEPEACVKWNNSIVISIQAGNVYKLDF